MADPGPLAAFGSQHHDDGTARGRRRSQYSKQKVLPSLIGSGGRNTTECTSGPNNSLRKTCGGLAAFGTPTGQYERSNLPIRLADGKFLERFVGRSRYGWAAAPALLLGVEERELP
ncbi:uncharacterized protein TrAtP1_010332 [Trichoderma atroviride]|uniref:uncharacterized protein n=1 Tax=Hypocrea atroviridis TaxID=63577 RepID=UPI0033308B3B|nr:hypothetical protein TrAtP1_010332 [Trichoderma atroviride]